MLPLRLATTRDIPAIQALIAASVRGLSGDWYSADVIEQSIAHVFGVDTQLVADGTYYVIDDGGSPVAAGGWSARRTLYGGDQAKTAEDPRLDPAVDAARIRAFFVHPAMARRGLARRLYEQCEADAVRAGFTAFELAATLPGVPLYRTLGFAAHEPVTVPLPDGLTLACVRMTRTIGER